MSIDYTEARFIIDRMERECLDEATSPFDLEEAEDFRDMMYYIEGIRTMARCARNELDKREKQWQPFHDEPTKD